MPVATHIRVPTIDALTPLEISLSGGWWVWIDLSFSLLQAMHLHTIPSLHEVQYSVGVVSPPHALHSIGIQ